MELHQLASGRGLTKYRIFVDRFRSKVLKLKNSHLRTLAAMRVGNGQSEMA